ncbi:hypothetical protein PLESTM_001181200 [Pleodorina starrii]|nr:hypothetical protein PLESTM_001181200 [Pleodorina starrii]
MADVREFICGARTWPELATITYEYGGAAALNEIHLAAALSRLAKMDLATSQQQLHQQQQQFQASRGASQHANLQPPSSSGSLGPRGMPRGASMARRPGLVPPAAPQRGVAAPGAPGWGAPRALPLSDLGSSPLRSAPSTPPPGLGPAAATAAASRLASSSHRAGTANIGYGARALAQPLPAASAEELFVELLEALARRCGGLDNGTRPAATAAAASTASSGGASRVGSREFGRAAVAAEAAPPPPARVLANATWGAARILLEVWPPLQSAASSGAAPRHPTAVRPGASAAPLAELGPGLFSVTIPPATGPGPSPGPGPGAALQLRRRATAALRALLARVPEAADSLEPQHISNLLYSVARLAEQLPEVLQADGGSGTGGGGGSNGVAAAAETAAVVGAERPPALPRVGIATRRLVATLLDVSLSKLASFGPQALSNSLYAVAVLGVPPPQAWLSAWLDAAGGQLPRADPQHIANMLWALARLGCDPGDPWVVRALQAAALKAPAFTTQGLCNTLWGLAKLNSVAYDAVKARALMPLLTGLGSAARECDGQDVANGMWALARLHMRLPPQLPLSSAPPTPAPGFDGPSPSPQQQQHQKQQQQQGSPASASASAIRETLRSAGHRLLEASSRHLHAYSPQQLANASWAAGVLGLSPAPDWTAQFWPAAQAALPAMRTEELVAAAMASARLGLQPPDQFLAAMLELTSQAMIQQGEQEQAAAGAAAADCDPRVVGSADVGGCGGGSGGGPAAGAQTRFQATGRALSSLLWCVEAWGVRVPVAWTSCVLGRLEALAAAGALEPAALATALQAMARMGLRPDAVVAGWTRRVLGAFLATAAGLGEGEGEPAGASAVLVSEGRAPVRLRPAGRSGGGSGPTAVGGGLDARCARMLLWSLARLRCQVPDDVAGAFALAASECDSPAASSAGFGGLGAMAASSAVQSAIGADGKLVGGGKLAVLPAVAMAAAGGASALDAPGAQGRESGKVTGVGEEGEGGKGARNVCVALWALARLSSRPKKAVMQRLARRATADVSLASESELSTLIRAFAALGFRPGAGFRRAAEARAVCLAPALSEEQVASLLASCSGLKWRLSEGALAALRGASRRDISASVLR